jgi:hypothetical protein
MLDLIDYGIRLEAPLKAAICGDSGMGKSYLFKKLRDIKTLGDSRLSKVCLLDYEYIDNMESVLTEVDSSSLVLVDKWELTSEKFPGLSQYLSKTRAQVIVFGRLACGFSVMPICVGILSTRSGVLEFEFPLRRK